jgi:hypothetical protein
MVAERPLQLLASLFTLLLVLPVVGLFLGNSPAILQAGVGFEARGTPLAGRIFAVERINDPATQCGYHKFQSPELRALCAVTRNYTNGRTCGYSVLESYLHSSRARTYLVFEMKGKQKNGLLNVHALRSMCQVAQTLESLPAFEKICYREDLGHAFEKICYLVLSVRSTLRSNFQPAPGTSNMMPSTSAASPAAAYNTGKSSGFFGFYRVSGVSQRWEFKNTTKNVVQKIASKSFYQKIDKKSKPNFCRFVLLRFWAFLGEGSSKTP